jgi:hypothetical protein
VYGPVRTVVWQGSAGNRCPYADLTGKPEGICSPVGLVPTNALALTEPINYGMVGNRSAKFSHG